MNKCDYVVEVEKVSGDNGDNLYYLSARCPEHGQIPFAPVVAEKEVDEFLSEGLMHAVSGQIPFHFYQAVETALLKAVRGR